LETGAAKILCIEYEAAESRCAVLKYSGYAAASVSPQVAEILLRSQKFDLIVISSLKDSDLHRIINFSDGAKVLVLEEFTLPSELALVGGTTTEPPAESVGLHGTGYNRGR
jgi:hypothetical protein